MVSSADTTIVFSSISDWTLSKLPFSKILTTVMPSTNLPQRLLVPRNHSVLQFDAPYTTHHCDLLLKTQLPLMLRGSDIGHHSSSKYSKKTQDNTICDRLSPQSSSRCHRSSSQSLLNIPRDRAAVKNHYLLLELTRFVVSVYIPPLPWPYNIPS